MLLLNGKVFDGKKFVGTTAILILHDRIIKVYPNIEEAKLKKLSEMNEVIDLAGMIVSPGFIDLQLNGCGGVLLNNDISKGTLETMNRTNHRFGCTSFLPTLITSSDEKIIKSLELIEGMKKNKEDIGVLGLHIEGPEISLKKKGIHNPDYIRDLSDEMINRIAESGGDNVKMLTIAPERATRKQLMILRNSGIHLSMGHTNATYAECVKRKDFYTQATHFFNAMSPFESREPGVVGFLLDKAIEEDIRAGIIVDGFHADYNSVRVVHKNLKDNLYLVTDAVSPAGTNMTEFEFEGKTIYYKDGKCVGADGTLGGSALTMIEGVKNLVEHVGLPLEGALRMATSNPAKAIRIDDNYGYIREGYIADLTFFDSQYNIKGTIAKGKLHRF